jgi:phosphoglycerol transferase MdoB-like AlkP superfamily enzyme
MPNRFAGLGYQTSFFFGGDSTIQRRYKYIRRIGFQQQFWTDSTTSDAVMASKIDSLLSQSDSLKQFIAWTTRDTRFPISEDVTEAEKLYYERLFGTLQIVADLAKKHPEVHLVVQGDHEPILSPLEFQRKFYRRWVPFVVLN